MVRIMKKDGNRLEGIGERIAVRLTLLEEALGMTPGDPEIYGNWIASKAPEPEVGEEEVGVILDMGDIQDPAGAILRGRFSHGAANQDGGKARREAGGVTVTRRAMLQRWRLVRMGDG